MSSQRNLKDHPPPDGHSTAEADSDNIIIVFTSFQYKVLLYSSILFALLLAIALGVWLQDERTSHWTADPSV